MVKFEWEGVTLILMNFVDVFFIALPLDSDCATYFERNA